MYIIYNIHKSKLPEIGDAARELLRQIPGAEQAVRLVFFGATNNNEQYLKDYAVLQEVITEWFPADRKPLLTYVCQKPLDCAFALETQTINRAKNEILEFKTHKDSRYAVINGHTIEKMLMTEAVRPSSLSDSIYDQSHEVFEVIKEILEAEEMVVKNIDRQWNYIEEITKCDHKIQHYQLFNDARSEFYADTHWSGGYPAATGIGTVAGGVMVEIDAATLKNTRTVALDNNLQVAAHEYSKDVLLGEETLKTTPKFERARAIVYQSVFGDREAQVYISGTAAIRGEQSLVSMDIMKQTRITLENIEYLISPRNLERHGIEPQRYPQIKNFRVYLKYEKDFSEAQSVIRRSYPTVPCLYVISDVCRDELLIEIEGMAE